MTPTIRSKPKVLLVDNNINILNTLATLLQDIDCDIYKATNGMEAFEQALHVNFNLVISELFLPQMDGNELVRKIRQLSYGKRCVFIFLTNAISEDMQVKCMNDGADEIIIKPIKKKIFKSQIEGMISRINENQTSRKKRSRNSLNPEFGEIVYCKAENAHSLVAHIALTVNEVTSYCDFEEVFASKSIWMIFIDDKATWALNLIYRMAHHVGASIPIWLIASRKVSESLQMNFIENGGFGILIKYKNPEILAHQIEVLIDREISIKNQYVSSLKQAVLSSPVHFAPSHKEDFPTFRLRIKYEPFTKPAGGDFYEIVKMGNGNTLILLGDVMGKKWGAWFFANAYLAYIRASLKVFPAKKQLEIDNNLGLLLSDINQFLYKDIQLSDAFTTLTAILVNPSQQQVILSSAGAIYPIFYSKKTQKTSVIPIKGKILGIVENEKYSSEIMRVHPGDQLLLVTDGYTEAFDATKEKQIGIEKIASTLEAPLNEGVFDLDKLELSIMANNSIDSFNDDRTMLLVEFK
ncbi:fused response regulator/phosphatase [uncultured Acetobacteroides sp.]|uniref:fused response regulator/phosphatase n=1 Tax=uncultured Acetobacteroides sp. TaxID=1760811 RepID=UPI0029F59340|nr:fused response regulator/phosphatase [uncultured Acetobacteroides sp.]